MGQRPSAGIGKRLAYYRQLSGLSARELAEEAGMGLTRGVIANIESGRKTDITVDQLIALSDVLGVPPVALALPIDEPFRFIRLTEGRSARLSRAFLASMLFAGEQLPDGNEIGPRSTGAAGVVAFGRWDTVRRYLDATASLDYLREHDSRPDDQERLVSDIARLERDLQQLQVDMTMFKVDD